MPPGVAVFGDCGRERVGESCGVAGAAEDYTFRMVRHSCRAQDPLSRPDGGDGLSVPERLRDELDGSRAVRDEDGVIQRRAHGEQ